MYYCKHRSRLLKKAASRGEANGDTSFFRLLCSVVKMLTKIIGSELNTNGLDADSSDRIMSGSISVARFRAKIASGFMFINIL